MVTQRLQTLLFCDLHNLDEKMASHVQHCVTSLRELSSMPMWQLRVLKAYIAKPPVRGGLFRYYPRLWAALEARKTGGKFMSEEELQVVIHAAR